MARALAEDIGTGDLSAGLIAADAHLTATVISRSSGVLAGQAWFDECFRQLDAATRIEWRLADGAAIAAGDRLCRLQGPARAILSAERTALNFLQLLSGTASLAAQFVAAVAGSGVIVLDTRKTIPGLRQAQKYAVRAGGARNHRMGLFDAILLKENHIHAAGGVVPAIRAAHTRQPGRVVEIEVEDLEQLADAVRAGADRALLDNFTLEDLRRAAAAWGDRVELEASGNISLANIGAVAACGVHFISVGALTKRVEPLDLSLRFEVD